MREYYDLVDKLYTYLNGSPSVNTVTFGDVFQVDLSKQTIFPLSHIIVNSVTTQEQVLSFNITVMAMDIVDVDKEATTDLFRGNNNEHDILNTQLAVLNKLVMVLRKGDLYTTKYQLDGDPTCEPFFDRFENQLAGWACTMDILIANDITICN